MKMKIPTLAAYDQAYFRETGIFASDFPESASSLGFELVRTAPEH
jgi:hypothetical protein